MINSYAYAHGKHLVSDYNNGNIYELDPDTFEDNGDTVILERVTQPVTADQLGGKGQRLLMSRLHIIMETGSTVLATGQGSDPQIMIAASYDGGKSFTNFDSVNVGRTGEGRIKVEWYNMASAYEICFKIRVSDPFYCAIHSAALDCRLEGW